MSTPIRGDLGAGFYFAHDNRGQHANPPPHANLPPRRAVLEVIVGWRGGSGGDAREWISDSKPCRRGSLSTGCPATTPEVPEDLDAAGRLRGGLRRAAHQPDANPARPGPGAGQSPADHPQTVVGACPEHRDAAWRRDDRGRRGSEVAAEVLLAAPARARSPACNLTAIHLACGMRLGAERVIVKNAARRPCSWRAPTVIRDPLRGCCRR